MLGKIAQPCLRLPIGTSSGRATARWNTLMSTTLICRGHFVPGNKENSFIRYPSSPH